MACTTFHGGPEKTFDPETMCGVYDVVRGRQCTRSLTCKAHSSKMKRTTVTRSLSFDILLEQYVSPRAPCWPLMAGGSGLGDCVRGCCLLTHPALFLFFQVSGDTAPSTGGLCGR